MQSRESLQPLNRYKYIVNDGKGEEDDHNGTGGCKQDHLKYGKGNNGFSDFDGIVNLTD